MIVYADILIFLNTIVTYFLLISVCAVLKKRAKTFRLILGALFGGVSALVIFLPLLGFFAQAFIRVLICSVTTLITFSFKNKIYFIKHCAVLLAVTYVYGGAMLAFMSIFDPYPFVFANGVAYIDISPMILIMSTAIIYLLINLFYKFKSKTVEEKLIYECEIIYKDVNIKVNTINDTGNHVQDPYFGSPVAIVEKTRLQKIFLCKPKTYLIPIKSVGKNDMLYAFRPDGFYIVNGQKRQKIDGITVAVAEKTLGKQYGGIISPKILEYVKEDELCLISKK